MYYRRIIKRKAQHWIILSSLVIALLYIALLSAVAAQKNATEGKHFIRRWLALGPFIEGKQAPKAIEVDYLLAATRIPESKFATLESAPKAGDGVSLILQGYDTQDRIWKALELPEDGDVNKMLVEEGEIDFTIAYLLTFIESKETTRRTLLIGSDDAVKVWLNGEVVHTAAVDRELMPDQDKVSVVLNKGLNCLMLKVADSTVDWQLTARFEDESGLQFFDTPERQMVPLGKRLIRLPNPQLETPKSEDGTGTEGVWKTYRYVDGLAGNLVSAIIQDKEGAIWLGTNGGVSRFDGKSWKTYTQKDGLANDDIYSIIQDKEGAIWVGTYGGVSRFDGVSWKTYTQKDGLANNFVRSLLQDKEGTIWVGTYGGGVSRFDGKGWKTYTQKDGLASNRVLVIIQDKEGTIWFGTRKAWSGSDGISRYDGRSWKTYSQKDGLTSNTVGSLLQDKEGAIWVGTWGGGVSRFDGKSWKTYTQKDGLTSNDVVAIIQDKEGAIWVGTWGGVSRFDGVSWKTYSQKDGLTSNNVQALLQDKEGAIWVGTWGGGVSRFDRVSWKTYTQKDGLASNSVWSLLQDKEGVIWVGTGGLFGGNWMASGGGGVSKFDGVSWKTYTQKDGLIGNNAHAIIQDREGAIWFGTWDGVSRFDGKSWKTYTQKDGLAGQFFAIMQDKEGAIWCGKWGGGVSRYDGKSWKTYTQKDGLGGNEVFAIIQDKEGAIWFGTWDGGVSRYDGKSWKTYTQKDGLASNAVLAIMQDKEGAIWFGTWGGVSRFDRKSWKTYTQKDGLTSNRVRTIIQDKEGAIWIGTYGGGISRFDGRCFQTLDSRDGLVNDAVYCLYMDRSGQIWIGTEGGVVRFNPPNKVSPPVYITQMIADETYNNPKGTIQLRSGIPRISVSYHAISLKTHSGGMKYFYQLIGKDKDWQGATNEETVEYFNLNPGEYIFKVQAVDRDLNYSEPASLVLKVLPPPFYTRTEFLVGSILSAFLIPTIIYTILLIRKKSMQVFEPIPNPYIVGNPIRSSGMFFGREDDFRFVQAKLGTGKAGLVIVFAGERRSGKTSILFQILNERLGEHFVPVLLDMQAMAVDSEGEFFEKLASEINVALEEQINLPVNVFREGNAIRVFEKLISDTMIALNGRSLLLLFDEYELIESKMKDGILRPEIITFFASLLEKHPGLSFIFTGSRHLEQRDPLYWSILIGKSIYRKISFLSEQDTMRLIKEPVQDSVVYPKGILERIYRLTAGQPFYTQVVCQNLVDRLNEVQRNRVRQEDIDAVTQELAENPLPQMTYFWDGLEPEQQIALSLLGEVLEDSIRYASTELMLNFVRKHNLGLSLESLVLERILDELFLYDVLERERADEGRYEYRFRVDLFRLWVRQAHSVWQVV